MGGGMNSESDEVFKHVRKPRRYFRVGRVFATRWAEPRSECKDAVTLSKASPESHVFEKTRRFIVVQESHGASLCVPIHTYSGRGSRKDNIRLEDHARVYHDKTNPPNREPNMREPIGVVVEPDSQLPQIHPQSLANFGKIYTVEHGVKVANIGYVHKNQRYQLQVNWKYNSSYGSNLRDGSAAYNEESVRLPCDGGADADEHGTIPDNALQVASTISSTMLRLLPGGGADVDVHGGISEKAREAASTISSTMRRLVRDQGAGLDADGGSIDNALQTASTVICLLLDRGAGLDAQSRVFDSTLQTASAKGHENIAFPIPDKGAETNMHKGVLNSALQDHFTKRHEILTPIPDQGTEKNTGQQDDDSALQDRSAKGHEIITPGIPDQDTGMNTYEQDENSVLQDRSTKEYEIITPRILGSSTRMHVYRQDDHSALQDCSAKEHEIITPRILGSSTRMHVYRQDDHSVLLAGSIEGHKGNASLVRDKGADMNASHGRVSGTPPRATPPKTETKAQVPSVGARSRCMDDVPRSKSHNPAKRSSSSQRSPSPYDYPYGPCKRQKNTRSSSYPKRFVPMSNKKPLIH